MQLKLRMQAEDRPLTVNVEPLGWDDTLAAEQSAWMRRTFISGSRARPAMTLGCSSTTSGRFSPGTTGT
jgi:hypothetical protein